MKDAKVIFSPQLANFLLKKGYQIINLKPKHDVPCSELNMVSMMPLKSGLTKPNKLNKIN